jgi:hypothetical protein
MHLRLCLVLVAACGKSASKGGEGSAVLSPPAVAAAPADDMDEKMRHCPLSIEGATAAYAAGASGVRWEVTATTATAIAEIRRRAKHVVVFAAGHSEKGVHGGGSGGGRMRNCPVVTSGVVISETEIEGGARLQLAPANPDDGEQLRQDTVARVKAFAFPGANVIERRP